MIRISPHAMSRAFSFPWAYIRFWKYTLMPSSASVSDVEGILSNSIWKKGMITGILTTVNIDSNILKNTLSAKYPLYFLTRRIIFQKALI